MRTDRETRIKALKVGAEAFLTKPPDETELIAQLRAMTKIRAACRLQQQEKERLAALVLERTRELHQELEERKQAEILLRDAKDRIKTILDLVGDPIFVKENDHRITLANRAFYDMFCLDEKSVIGKTLVEAVPENERRHFLEVDRRVLDTGIPDLQEEELTVNDFTRTIITRKTRFIDESGKRFLVGSIHDITERKQATEILEYERELYADLLNTQPAGIYRVRIFAPETWKKDAWLSSINAPYSMDLVTDRFCEILGVTKEAYAGNPGILNDLVHPEDKEEFTKVHEEAMTRLTRFYWEGRILIDEKIRWLSFESLPRTLENGDVLWTGACMDITERKQTEEELMLIAEELARSNVDLQQFAYVASHDLQEPLRMVSSYLQLIERRYKDRLDDDANTFIHYAVDGANRMQALIVGLLEFSRVKTHGQVFAPVEVTVVLQGVCRNLEAQIVESGAVIRYGKMPVIQADEAQITRLFQNLLQNALKFRREGVSSAIEIGAEKSDAGQVFSVHDNGIGIEQQYFERIFTIFQRLHTREQYPGTGIGLSICKRIVERHGGKIWLESTAGAGTSFYFSIPGELQ
jgi:PAS domain S-box-containing protein